MCRYPPYKSVVMAKSACLPPAASLTVLPDRAGSSLQALLNQTAGWLLQLQAAVVTHLLPADDTVSDQQQRRLRLQLTCKWESGRP